MGNFYTNIVLVGASASEVLRYLRNAKRAAYVLDDGDTGKMVVYDEKCDAQDIHEIHALAADLTKEFACSAIASLNADDDLLYISAYRDGDLVTEYDSSAGKRIQPMRLCRAAGVSILRAPAVLILLLAPNPLFAIFKHMLLTKALRLPRASAGSGYTYIDSGEPPVNRSHEPAPVVHTTSSDKPPPPIWER